MEQIINAQNIGIAAGVAIVIILAIVFILGYVKAPPDKVFIISGFRKEPKFVTGTSAIRIPFLQQKDELTLALIKVNVVTDEDIPTSEYINIRVDSNVNVKIDKTKLAIAAQHFLNANEGQISKFVCDVLQGNLREIVGQMKLEDMIKDRTEFNKRVTENVKPDLAAMGLELVSFNVQNFSDKNSVIVNMGIDNVETIRKTAEIAKANAQRDIAVAKAKADLEENDARVKADTTIAERNNALEIKQHELKQAEQTKKAVADSAYKIELANQQKDINVANAKAETARQEQLILVREKEVEVKEKELNANVIKPAEAEKTAVILQAEAAREAEIINADANLKKTEKNAEANLIKETKDAEAQLIKETKDAEAELIKNQKASEAKRYNDEQTAIGTEALAKANLVKAKNEAEGIEANGKATASAIEAKGKAEAEALDKKADAMKKYGDAAIMDMQLQVSKALVEKMPEIAAAVAAPFAKVGKIEMYGSGNTKMLAEDITSIINQVSGGLSSTLGIDGKMFLSSALANIATKGATSTASAPAKK